jgi:ABC-type multidrug transport system fused ATPase/permease subunit
MAATVEFTPVGSAKQIRVLASFFRPHWVTVVGGTVLGLTVTATTLWTPMVVEQVMSALAANASMTRPIMVLAVLTVIGIAAMLAQWVLLGSVAENVVYDVRAALVHRFLRGRVRDVTARPAGELVTRATSDALLLREAASSSLVELVNGVVGVVGTIVLMGVIDGVLLSLTVAAIVVFGGMMAAIMPRVGVARAGAQAALGRMGGQLEGGVRAIRTIKVAGAEQQQSDAVLTEAASARAHGITAVRAEAMAWTAAIGGIQAATVAIIALGAWRVSQGYLTVAALVAFLMYVFNFSDPMMELATGLSNLQSGLAAVQRITETERIELEEDATSRVHSSTMPEVAPSPGRAILEFQDVTASYTPHGKAVVRDLSLKVPRVGHMAIVGPSGAGKTSVLFLALRFLTPRTGRVLLDGTDYDRLGYAQVRERFAYVEQETPVVPGTIRENLLFANPHATEEELNEVLDTVLLTEELAKLPDGLETSLVSSTVSGGQRQRIAMARALLRRADILLLDEATSQVDGRTEAAIHAAVKAAARTGVVITVAHRLSTVVDADTIVVMENGTVRAAGTHAALLEADDLYHELVTAPRINDGT